MATVTSRPGCPGAANGGDGRRRGATERTANRHGHRGDLFMGRAARELGQLHAAAGHFRQAFRLDPQDAEPLLELAFLLRSQQRHDQADAVFAQIRDLDPDDPETLPPSPSRSEWKVTSTRPSPTTTPRSGWTRNSPRLMPGSALFCFRRSATPRRWTRWSARWTCSRNCRMPARCTCSLAARGRSWATPRQRCNGLSAPYGSIRSIRRRSNPSPWRTSRSDVTRRHWRCIAHWERSDPTAPGLAPTSAPLCTTWAACRKHCKASSAPWPWTPTWSGPHLLGSGAQTASAAVAPRSRSTEV